jgi:transposase
VARVAALDIGKAELVCCIRVPGQGRRSKRPQEVATDQTMTRSLLVVADRPAEVGVTRVVMEATGDSWKAPLYLLEAQGFAVWLVNAKDVKHLPGRPKTDQLDAVWLAKLAERGRLRPSFVPPLPIRRLRDLTRYRADLVAVPTAEKQRAEQAAGWTPRSNSRWWPATSLGSPGGPCWTRWSLASVTQAASPAGPHPAARQAGPTPRGLHRAVHRPARLPAGTMLSRIDQASADIAELEATIDEMVAPFQAAVDRLDEITGVGRTAAQTIVAEIGVDMGRFPTPSHLASWARFAPGVKQSAGKVKGKSPTGHGNPSLARVLGEAAVAAGRTNTFLGERYRRGARRRGTNKAIVAVGRSILVIVWHLLADPPSAITTWAPASTTPTSTLRAPNATTPPAGGPREPAPVSRTLPICLGRCD